MLGRDEGGEQETGLDAVSPRWHPAPAAEAGTCAPKRLPQARLRSDEEGSWGHRGGGTGGDLGQRRLKRRSRGFSAQGCLSLGPRGGGGRAGKRETQAGELGTGLPCR